VFRGVFRYRRPGGYERVTSKGAQDEGSRIDRGVKSEGGLVRD